MNWTVKEHPEDGRQIQLVVEADGELQGLVSVEMSNGTPSIKYLTMCKMETATHALKVATEFLLEQHSHPRGVFAYTYDYKDYEQEWFKEVGFSLFRYLDDGARALYHLPAPTLN
jgi:hypothetical protein